MEITLSELLLLLLPSLLAMFFFKVFDELEQHSELNKWNTRSHKFNLWLNKNTGWKNKHNWKPSWLFKTAFVFLTDGEHFFQMLKHLSVAIAFGLLFYHFSFTLFMIVTAVAMASILFASFIMNEIIL